jgi:1,4-dihydroxy-2-naphthoyl-CoA hydrolase
MSFNKSKVLDLLNKACKNTLMETLSIEYIDAGEHFLKAKMPVTSKVLQPRGLLHGGATVALAESVGSAASRMVVDEDIEIRGIEIAANHLKAVREGLVYATARIVHKGKTTHLWEIRVEDENGSLVSVCKLTNIVLQKR